MVFGTQTRRAVLLAGAALAALGIPGAAQAAEGMPQLNFANPLTLSQAGWMFVIFLLLYLAVKHWGLPQVAEVLEVRAASIRGDLDAAMAAKHTADAAVAELTEVTRQAHAEAQARINNEVAAAKQEAAARAAEANAVLDARLAEAEARIAAARGAAMGALRQVAAETTAAVVQRLLGNAPDAARLDHAVGAALATRKS